LPRNIIETDFAGQIYAQALLSIVNAGMGTCTAHVGVWRKSIVAEKHAVAWFIALTIVVNTFVGMSTQSFLVGGAILADELCAITRALTVWTFD
jgi:hypothetical protein